MSGEVRPGSPLRVFVQPSHGFTILEQGADVYAWLQEGASVFVCGDARRMAPDVDRALREVIRVHGAMDDEGAASYLSRLTAAGRYRRDVY